jgi:hypothetical protein
MALASAASAGDNAPSDMAGVLTRRQAAQDATHGDIVNANEPVYLVVITGHFVANDVSVPAGQPAPRGTTITMSIDTSTMQTVDWGLSSQSVSLDSLGTPFSLR